MIKKIAQSLKSDRKKLNLSQRQVQKMTGIFHTTVGKLENGKITNSKHLQPLLIFYAEMLNKKKPIITTVKSNKKFSNFCDKQINKKVRNPKKRKRVKCFIKKLLRKIKKEKK